MALLEVMGCLISTIDSRDQHGGMGAETVMELWDSRLALRLVKYIKTLKFLVGSAEVERIFFRHFSPRNFLCRTARNLEM